MAANTDSASLPTHGLLALPVKIRYQILELAFQDTEHSSEDKPRTITFHHQRDKRCRERWERYGVRFEDGHPFALLLVNRQILRESIQVLSTRFTFSLSFVVREKDLWSQLINQSGQYSRAMLRQLEILVEIGHNGQRYKRFPSEGGDKSPNLEELAVTFPNLRKVRLVFRGMMVLTRDDFQSRVELIVNIMRPFRPIQAIELGKEKVRDPFAPDQCTGFFGLVVTDEVLDIALETVKNGESGWNASVRKVQL